MSDEKQGTEQDLVERAYKDLYEVIEGTFLTVREEFDAVLERFLHAFVATQREANPEYKPTPQQLYIIQLTLIGSFSAMAASVEKILKDHKSGAQSLAVIAATKRYAKENYEHWKFLKAREDLLVPEAEGKN